MKIYSFIFVRKNSKRIIKKNLKKINGKSLLNLSIDFSKKISVIDKTFVSTDCEQMAKIAKRSKCEVILRPKKLTSDNSPEIESWKHAVQHVKKNFDKNFIFLSLPVTSPLRRKKEVINCIEAIKKFNYDICLTITKTNLDPNFNMLEFKNSKFKPAMKISNNRTSKKFYTITTVAYGAKTSFIERAKNILDGNVQYLNVPFPYSIDIDELSDLKIAKIFMRK
jgi:CMP-N-acetylneuraminic acid synthetase